MRLFDADDYETFADWFYARGLPAPPVSELPAIGFIEDFCAVGFLVETDTKTAVLDFFISNPECPKKEREKAITEISLALIEHAKRRKFKRTIIRTQQEAACNYAQKLGFKGLGNFTVFVKEI